MANQVLTIVTFTTLLIARIEPVSTYKISSADPDVIRINLGEYIVLPLGTCYF